MVDLFLNDGAVWFTFPAVIGTAFFLLRVLSLLAGGGHESGLDFHGDAGGGDHHSDSGHDFQILSIQSIATFMMGFGWTALGALRGLGWEIPATIGLGCAGGIGMVYLLAILLKGMADLQSSGTISIEAAMGREGDVYVTVPGSGGGRGQVRVTLHEQQRIYNAVSTGEDLPSGTRVRVVKVNQDNTLTVARA